MVSSLSWAVACYSEAILVSLGTAVVSAASFTVVPASASMFTTGATSASATTAAFFTGLVLLGRFFATLGSGSFNLSGLLFSLNLSNWLFGLDLLNLGGSRLDDFNLSGSGFDGSGLGRGSSHFGMSGHHSLLFKALSHKVKVSFRNQLGEGCGSSSDVNRVDLSSLGLTELSHDGVHGLFIFSRTFLEKLRVFLNVVHHSEGLEGNDDIIVAFLLSKSSLGFSFLGSFFLVDVPVRVTLLVEVDKLIQLRNFSFEGSLTVQHELLVFIRGWPSLLHGLLEGDDLVHLLSLVAEVSA